MTFGDVNYLAVLVAAVAYWLLGALWYSPPLFAKQWAAGVGISLPQSGERPPIVLFVTTFIAFFVVALAMAFLAGAGGAVTFGQGLLLGLITGVGFVVTVLLVTHAYEQRPASVWLINAGYHLVGFVITASIVSVWQ